VANKGPEEKDLQYTSFVVHATRGVIRAQSIRRKTMFALLVLAMLLLFSGITFLAPMLNPREHLVAALFFWIACVWLTLTALLLALFDLVSVRRTARQEALKLRQQHSEGASGATESPRQDVDSGINHDA
jgi:membrane protein implicated in regulation of membrane protease activity